MVGGRMGMFDRALLLLAVGTALSGSCSSPTPDGVSQASPTVTTVAPPLEPLSPAELGIQFDPDGRPYDAVGVADDTAETRFLALMHFAGGHVRVMDGSGIEVDPAFFADEATAIEFGAVEDLRVSIVWQRSPFEGELLEYVLGVRLDVEGRVVERWGAFELAYGTDGGTGGVTSQEVIDRAAVELGEDEFLIEDRDYEADYELGDYDGRPGLDTLVFANGSGDGGFPLSRGFDAAGDLAAVMIWDPRFPWRLAVPDGTPPPDVTTREDQLQECLDGTRLADQYGACSE